MKKIPPQQQLSVVAPCFNESAVIDLFYHRLKSQLLALPGIRHEIVFVDDGSSDDTPAKLRALAQKDPCVKVLILSRNFGHQIALTAGIDAAQGDVLIMMDSDLQHPVELIGELLRYWREGYEIVSTVRDATDGASFFKSWSSTLFYHLFNRMTRVNLPVGAADFCLLARPVFEQLRAMRERHRFLRGLICWMGYRKKLIRYQADRRAAGHSKYSLAKMTLMAFEATLSFSTMPIQAAMKLGLTVVAAGFLYLFWILGMALTGTEAVSGWRSLICATLILGGFQLMFIGLIGEYIAMIFEQVKDRPLYLVRRRYGSVFTTSPAAETPQSHRHTVPLVKELLDQVHREPIACGQESSHTPTSQSLWQESQP